MYCGSCGAPIGTGQRFCAACGAPVVIPRGRSDAASPPPGIYGAPAPASHDHLTPHDAAEATQPASREARRSPFAASGAVTVCLLAALVVAFIVESGRPGGSESTDVLYALGATTPDTLVSGQAWRLVASAFLHIGVVHLVGNAIALFWLGWIAERLYGPLRFLGIYLFAGLGGSLLTVLVGPDALSAGAFISASSLGAREKSTPRPLGPRALPPPLVK